jgi:prepilin-type N-terminal cleavage/methylation domain-containing protein
MVHHTKLSGRDNGFSLVEVLVTIVIMVVVTGTVLSAAARYMQRYRGQQLIVEVNQTLRATQELLTQEVGQAGLHGMSARATTAVVIGSPVAQAVPVDDASGLFVGQKLSVNGGADHETVEVAAVGGNTVTGAFRKNHPAGTRLTTIGPFATGVLAASTANVLQIYGDVDAEDTLTFVEYRYVPATRRLTRAVTPVGATVQQAAAVILENVLPNASGAPVFQYRTLTRAGMTFVIEVVVTLTVQAAGRDPITGGLRTQTAVLSLTPRNTLAAFALAGFSGRDNLQSQPPNLPIPVP